MRKICFVITTRGNYLKTKSTMDLVRDDKDLKLQVVVGGILLQRDYGSVIIKRIRKDYGIDAELDFNIIPDTYSNISKSSGWAAIRFTNILQELNPDIVVVTGDRFEVLPITMASVYMNKMVAHIEGGEITGSIDESIRHAVTKLSHIHFPATEEAGAVLNKLGESAVYVVGSSGFDLVKEIYKENKYGDYLLVVVHPVFSESDFNRTISSIVTKAITEFGTKTIWVGSNYDVDSSYIKPKHNLIEYVRGLDSYEYLNLLYNCKCIIGNSSSGIRESSFLGVPSINIGNRQEGRERCPNVIDVDCNTDIVSAIEHQLGVGRYKSSTLYGDGNSGPKIYEVLKNYCGTTQKRLNYIKE